MAQRVIQFFYDIMYGDAISDHMLELWRVFAESGFESFISSANIDIRLPEKDSVIHISDLEIRPNDILIYHFGTDEPYVFLLGKKNCRKVLIFHNTTPSIFAMDYARPVGTEINEAVAMEPPLFFKIILNQALKSRRDVRMMPQYYPIAWTDSNYNASCLRKAGFSDIDVLPIPFSRNNNNIVPTSSIVEAYKNTRNILFVGRIISNKKQVDIIKAFAYYKKIVPNSNLFLVGNFTFGEKYQEEFLEYIKSMELEDSVHMPGKVSHEDLEAYWKVASLFLSMSEHEGFFVPLLEAFAHEVPVLAYASSAVPETMGNAGILFYEKNFSHVAEVMNSIIESPERVSLLKAAGRERINSYKSDILAKHALELLQKVCDVPY